MDTVDELTSDWLLDRLPIPVMLIDDSGRIVDGSAPLGMTIGRSVDEIVGREASDFIDGERDWDEALAMTEGTVGDFQDDLGGPVRTAIRADDGSLAATDLWAVRRDGHVVVALVPIAASTSIVDVLVQLDELDDLEAATALCRTLGGSPIIADSALVRRTGAGAIEVIAHVGVPRALVDGTVSDATFDQGLGGEAFVIEDLSDVPGPFRDLGEAAGYRAAWFEPAFGSDGAQVATVVAFQRRTGPPGPNALTAMRQVASLYAAVASRAG